VYNGEDHDVIAVRDLVEDAVRVGGDVTDIVIAQFGDDATNAR
jgi:hypothetical protein